MKLWATIKKDLRLLLRDRIGLALMFGMPILLVLIVTGIQNNVFQSFTSSSVVLFVSNKDTGRFSRELTEKIKEARVFRLESIDSGLLAGEVAEKMKSGDGELTLIIPADFSLQMRRTTQSTTGKALKAFGLNEDSGKAGAADTMSLQKGGQAGPGKTDDGKEGAGRWGLDLLYNPAIDASLKLSAEGVLNGALQTVESREVLKSLYYSINEKDLPDTLEDALLYNRLGVRELPVTRGGAAMPVNATQHNVPAWTIFAMFFVVMSLSGGVVREKLNGSFIRLKTLPTNYMIALWSKQLTYLGVTFSQALVIFSLGLWVFPHIGLPALSMPHDIAGLFVVTLLCGWCAVSYAILVGVFARTQEQANGFGAVSVVILSIIGGLMIPAFIMPGPFRTAMNFSPLHWALEAYYGLFLEGGKLRDILINVLPLLVITLVIQLIIFIGLKRKKLI